jgi:putative photosynthetic complex assembly protein 2
MFDYALPVLFVLLAWWFSTGAILYLDGLPRRTFRWSMGGMTALLALSFYGLSATADDVSEAGAYVAFACALGVWGWQEMAFLMGYVTGPRRGNCPPGATGLRRFVFATQTILHHEIALAVAGTAVCALSWGAANKVGAWTFLILWVMRLSAKLNLFLGVRNTGAEMLPVHLRHLATYFARRPMNLLFPVTVTLATVAAGFLWNDVAAIGPDGTGFAAGVLLGTLLTLAILEHWFLVVPLPVNALWAWGMASHVPGSGGDVTIRMAGPAVAAAPSGVDVATERRRP